MKNQVLVTGGTGFIGSHTVVELQNEGFEVIIVDDLSNSHAEVIDNIEKITQIRPFFEQFNLTDAQKTNDLFEKYPNIGSVIHFAASKAVGESVEKPLHYYKNNVGSLINILSAMKEHNVANIVFSSSCTVYGQPDILPVTEKAPFKAAASPYGNTKQICEEILRDTAYANKSVNTIALRYFNPIGAHETALIGEIPLGVPDNLVPFVTQTAIGLRSQLKVFGGDYNTPDGTCLRDYIHVVDLAKAHVIAIKRLIETKNKSNYEFFNLGTGKPTSVLEIIQSFEKVSGKKLNYQIVDRREGDVEKVWAETSFANDELGWKSETGIDETMASAWKWEQLYRASH